MNILVTIENAKATAYLETAARHGNILMTRHSPIASVPVDRLLCLEVMIEAVSRVHNAPVYYGEEDQEAR